MAGLLRRCKSAIRVRRYSDLVEFVLAMGSIGEKWYIRSGVSQERVFPFCYVVEPPMQGGEVDAPGSTNGVYQVAYLGQMVERKGVDVLIRALARCRTSNWRADFVGSGVGEENFQALSKMCGLADRITFHPALMNRVAMTLLSRADLLVLPSRWDGWGAVVNEALMRGVPVICTSNCGASDLLRHPWLGSVVPAGSVGALADALEQWISRGPRAESESVRIQAWSQCIHPRVVADYFLKIMGHVYDGGPRPEVPWRA
ncbi:MAG: glycosyltransferase [Bryobacteraceae bacterium]|nr:glycosyltransferase [Bryobacteraceae bacterium]